MAARHCLCMRLRSRRSLGQPIPVARQSDLLGAGRQSRLTCTSVTVLSLDSCSPFPLGADARQAANKPRTPVPVRSIKLLSLHFYMPLTSQQTVC